MRKTDNKCKPVNSTAIGDSYLNFLLLAMLINLNPVTFMFCSPEYNNGRNRR